MKLLWLDLETTGLDPFNDQIIEIAFARADLDKPFKLETCVDSYVIPYNGSPSMCDFVRDMHARNGLLAECTERGSLAATFGFYCPEKSVLHAIENRLLLLVPEEEDKKQKMVLAGNSVHFDLSFIRNSMPRLAARLSHRVYDISAVRLFCRSLGMPESGHAAPAHRAADDVKASIEEGRALSQWLRQNSGTELQ